MTKKEVQQRVLQNGKPLPLDKFEWDEKTKTFSSDENHLVLDFGDINNCTFNTGSDCTFKTGEHCVAVRWDIYGVIKIPANTEIKLNEYGIRGYQIIDKSVGKK